MTRPLLLDLFCGAGGAAMGYHRAGFDVVGVDIKPQPHYPFPFVQADALAPPLELSTFDVIHASPPCQFASPLRHMWNAKEHDDLIAPTRELLKESGRPYVIENVPQAARLGSLRAWLVLCGSQFGLGTGEAELRRHRYFETSFPIMASPCQHGQRALTVTVVGHAGGMRTKQKRVIGVYGGHGRRRTSAQDFSTAERREAMGIDWMTGAELSQAIPPAYTEFIGGQLLGVIDGVLAGLRWARGIPTGSLRPVPTGARASQAWFPPTRRRNVDSELRPASPSPTPSVPGRSTLQDAFPKCGVDDG